MSVANIDQAQAAVDALIAELEQPDPGTVFIKVANLDLTGAGSGANAVADITLLVDHDADIICLQGAASWLGAITTAFAAAWTIFTPDVGSTDSEDVPILLRTDRFLMKTSGTINSTHEITWASAIHLESSQKVQVANTICSPTTDGETLYAAQVGLLTTRASKFGAKSVGIVAGSFGVDYIQRDQATAWWPQRTLGGVNYSYCWSYLSDDALGAASTIRGDGTHQVTSGVFHRKDPWIAWAGTVTISTTHASSFGVLATYEMSVKEAVEPDETEVDGYTPDQPIGGVYVPSLLTIGSLNLRITLSLANSRADFDTVNTVAGGLDLFGLQEMQGIERRDFFGTVGLAPFRDIHVQPNRTRSRGCDANPVGWRADRFAYQSGSGKAILLTDKFYYEVDGDKAGLMYATEARLRDRLTGRYITVWSMHTPPHVEDHASGLPRVYDFPKRIPVLLDCMAAMQRRSLKVPEDELFVVTGDLNWDAFKNVWESRPNVWFERAGMTVVWKDLGANGTVGTLDVGRWVDYIAMSKRSWARFTDVGVVTAVNTDHDPPWAKIRIKPA